MSGSNATCSTGESYIFHSFQGSQIIEAGGIHCNPPHTHIQNPHKTITSPPNPSTVGPPPGRTTQSIQSKSAQGFQKCNARHSTWLVSNFRSSKILDLAEIGSHDLLYSIHSTFKSALRKIPQICIYTSELKVLSSEKHLHKKPP